MIGRRSTIRPRILKFIFQFVVVRLTPHLNGARNLFLDPVHQQTELNSQRIRRNIMSVYIL